MSGNFYLHHDHLLLFFSLSLTENFHMRRIGKEKDTELYTSQYDQTNAGYKTVDEGTSSNFQHLYTNCLTP